MAAENKDDCFLILSTDEGLNTFLYEAAALKMSYSLTVPKCHHVLEFNWKGGITILKVFVSPFQYKCPVFFRQQHAKGYDCWWLRQHNPFIPPSSTKMKFPMEYLKIFSKLKLWYKSSTLLLTLGHQWTNEMQQAMRNISSRLDNWTTGSFPS